MPPQNMPKMPAATATEAEAERRRAIRHAAAEHGGTACGVPPYAS